MNGAEKRAVLDALEAEYDSADAAAKGTYNAVLGALRDRKSFVVGVNIGAPDDAFWIPFGPFWSMGEASKFRKGLGLKQSDIQVIYGPSTVTEDVSTRKHCPDCEHPWLAHSYGTECIVPGCSCTRTWSARGWS